MAKPKQVQTDEKQKEDAQPEPQQKQEASQDNVRELAQKPAQAQKPSIGRIVLYTPNRDVQEGHKHRAFAALVTDVAADGSVSLAVFAPNSTDRVHGVKFSGEALPGAWTWPPRV